GGQMRGVGTACAACHDNGGNNCGHLTRDSDTYEIGDVDSRPKLLQLHGADEGENGAHQAVYYCDNAESADSRLPNQVQYVGGASVGATAQGCRAFQYKFTDERGYVGCLCVEFERQVSHAHRE